MTFQTPNPTAQPNDPAAWVTTGTPVPGSSDPKTVEMLATIKRLVAEYGATQISTVGPKYANWLLLPDGTVTSDLGIAQFSVPWMADAYAKALAAKRYLILYWGPRMPIGTIWATEEPLAVAIHDAVVQGSVAAGTPGQLIGTTTQVVAAESAATAAAITTQPTAPVAPSSGGTLDSQTMNPPPSGEALDYPTSGISGALPEAPSSKTGGGPTTVPGSVPFVGPSLNFGATEPQPLTAQTVMSTGGFPWWVWLLVIGGGLYLIGRRS